MQVAHVQRVAHRGGGALAPENTLAAFGHALSLPVDAIELDVQMSRDGHLVVFHDATIERLTNGQGNLLDLDFADLRALNAAAHFPGGWPQPQQIPTLREVLNLARQGKSIQAFIEIKSGRRADHYSRYPGIAEAVIEEVLAADMLARVLIMSFDWDILPRVKELAPGIQTGAIVSERVWDPLAPEALPMLVTRARSLQCEWIQMKYNLFLSEMPGLFHANDLRLGVWVVNDAASLQRLARDGVDALTTDQPDLFAALHT